MGEGHSKVRFDLSTTRISHEWPPVDHEDLWALRQRDGNYKIDSIPYYAYAISMGDIVGAKPDKNGVLRYEAVHRRGGHSTFRIRLTDEAREDDRPFVRQMLSTLKGFGCLAEGDGHGVLAIDAPPGCPLDAVYDVLELGASEGIWEFETGYDHAAEEIGPKE